MRRLVLDSYARGSAAGGRTTSLFTQHEMNVRRIRQLGAEAGLTLDDPGRPDDRSGWEALLGRLKSGASDGVMVFKVSRFLHPMEDALRLVELAEAFPVYDSDSEFDLTTADGQNALLDAARGERDYRHRLSARVKQGNLQKALRGEGRRGRYRPIGFEEDGTTVRESERPRLREAVRRILAGERWQDVCDCLNAEGFRSTAQDHTPECDTTRGSLTGVQYTQYQCECPRRPWTPTALRSALTAPRMAGYVKAGSDPTAGRIPGEPIINPADWEALLALMQSRRGRPPVDIYLCTGKDSPVRCGNCGSYLSVNSNGRGNTYGDGELRRYYRCVKTHGGCGRTVADWRALDKAVEALTVDRLSDPQHVRQIRQAQEARLKKRAPHAEKIAELEQVQEHWDARLNNGKVTPERHATLSDDLLKQIRAEREQLAALEPANALPLLDDETLADAARLWRSADPVRKRLLLRQAYLGLHITVDPGSSAEDDVRHRVSVVPATPPPP